MNIATRRTFDFVEITIDDGNIKFTKTFFKSEQREINKMIKDLIEACYYLADYTDKFLKEHLQELVNLD